MIFRIINNWILCTTKSCQPPTRTWPPPPRPTPPPQSKENSPQPTFSISAPPENQGSCILCYVSLAYWEPEVYSEPWHNQNSGIFKILVYSELWDIENADISKTLAFWEPKAYSEPYQTFMTEHFAKKS